MLTWVQMIIILCFHLNRFAFLCFKITAALLCDVIVSLEVRQVQLNNKDKTKLLVQHNPSALKPCDLIVSQQDIA